MQQKIIEGYRLSLQQEGLWLVGRDGLAYRAQCEILLEGDLNAGLFREALEEVVSRHEILRTTFHRLPGMEVPLQVIAQETELAYREICLSDATSAEQDVKVEELFRQERLLPFDIERGPLVRFTLITLSAIRRVLLVSIHSQCADCRTLKNLFEEIFRCYVARLLKTAPANDPVQYVDFAEWQHQLLRAEDAQEGREYWRDPSPSAFPHLVLPLESKPLQTPEFDPSLFSLSTGVDLAGKIEAVARNHDATVAGFLLACWQTLLWRLTDQPEVCIDCLCDGRKLLPLQEALGLFARYLPVSCHIEGDYRFGEVLRKADDALCAAYEHQEYYAAKHSNRPEEGSAEGFPIAFEFLHWPEERCLTDLRCSISRLYVCTDRFKLKLSTIRRGDALAIEIHFDPAFYSLEVIERLSKRFQTLLSGVIANPEIRVSEVDILASAEKHQLLVKWNETDAEYPQHMTLNDLFEARAALTPDAIAVASGEEELSYGHLNRRANQLARYLKRMGVSCETRVGLLSGRSLQSIEALLGILKAGGVYLPLDTGQPRQRLELILEDARVFLLLTDGRLEFDLPPESVRVVCLDSDREHIAEEDDEDLGERLSPHNLAYVIYTSGSTGKPKGVSIQQGSAVNYALALRKVVYDDYQGPPLRVSLNAPMVFDASIKQVLHLLFGHKLVLIPEDVRRDGERMLAYMLRKRLDVFDCTPTHLKMLLEAGLDESRDVAPGLILVGGEALDEITWALLASYAETRCFNHYGPTECTVNTTICSVDSRTPRPRIGRPIANTRLFLLDERLNPVPIGVAGELHIGGAGLARGYMNRADWTAEKFIPNPFSQEPGQRFYKSGDMARYFPDGSLEFVGRVDHQVKVRGHRIELGELEAVLRERAEVREVVVIVRRDESGGERLVAYVVLSPGCALSTEEMRQYMRERLPDYMVPSAFVFLEDLPLTRNGKIDRRALPAPEQTAPETKQDRLSPRTLVEEILTSIWAEVLEVKQVSLGDNFFQLGGHSLLATQLISRVREAFKIELPLRSLFETATVAELAERVQEAISHGLGLQVPPIERAPRDKQLQLSFAQQRIWFLDQLEPGNPVYFNTRPLQMTGRLYEQGLEQALGEIVRRHEILRTSFPVAGSQPVQMISPPQPLTLPVVDLGALAESERGRTAQRLIAELSRRPFNLAQLPLLRLSLLRLDPQSHIVLFAKHHIIIDGWSMGIFIQEVNQLYEAFSTGIPSPLAELPIQYGDFAHWQQQWLQGEALEAQLSYWRRQLADTTQLELPVSRPRPRAQTYCGAVRPILLSASVSDGLKELSRREGVTLYMSLLAAFKSLLYLYTGQEDIVVGTGIASRNRAEIERLIGFFINMLAMRTDLSGNPSFRELLKRVREVALTAYAHQDLPFEKIVAELRPQWDPARTSLFQAVFFMQNITTPDVRLADVNVNSWGLDPGIAPFDLMLFMIETPQGLTGGIDYNTDLFDDAVIGEMANYFEVLIEKYVADPDIRLLDIAPIQSEQEVESEAVVRHQMDEGDQFNFWL